MKIQIAQTTLVEIFTLRSRLHRINIKTTGAIIMNRIVIDAGHGGYDNGASYEGRLEKDDNLSLALALGRELSDRGYDVDYTRTTDVYDSPVKKAETGNSKRAELFISLHRNSSPDANQYSGVQTLVYDDSGEKAELARNINDALEQVGFRNINVQERPRLAVLKHTNMPAVLVETGFINNDYDNYLYDTKFDEIVKAIADAVDETYK
jgi:N-acetylmuramoyl-L-alanine amidase